LRRAELIALGEVAVGNISKKTQLAFHASCIFLAPLVKQIFQISVNKNPVTSLNATIFQDNAVIIESLTGHMYLAIFGIKVRIFLCRMYRMRLGHKLYYMRS